MNGLFGHASQLIDLFLGSNSQEQQLAQRANVSSSDFTKVAALGLPIILKQINRNTQNDAGLGSLVDALTKHQDVGQYQTPEEMTRHVDPQDGDKILGHVFENKQQEENIYQKIGNMIGIDEAAVKRVMILLAPIVLKYLADRQRNQNLDGRGVQRETNVAVEQLDDHLQKQQQEGGIFGDVLGNILKGSPAPKQQSGSIVGNILDYFS